MAGFIFGMILGGLIGFGTAGMLAACGDDLPRWYHPPDDCDGVSRLEDDPDGQYTR